MREEEDAAGARDWVQRPPALSSSPSKEHRGTRSLLPTATLSVNLVIHMTILLMTVRTAT